MLRRLQHEVRTLLRDEEPAEHLEDVPKWRQVLRFCVRVGQQFVKNRCFAWASALAYSTLLTLIPLLAVALGITTSILRGEEERIRGWVNQLLFNIAPQLMAMEESAQTQERVERYVMTMINSVQSGALGVSGSIALLVLIFFTLARVEETMNDIWGVTEGRSWYARLVNYWAAITLGPIVIAAGIGYSTSLRLQQTQDWLAHLPIIGSLLVRLIPLPLIALACALFFAFMPKAKVHWQAALLGGAVAGVLLVLNTELSVHFVTQASRNQTIYNSLAAVPVFMVGLYVFWLVLLLGAQVAHTFQNRRSYLIAQLVERVHQEGRELVALRVMIEAGRAFARGERAPTVDELADRLEVPGPLITRTASILLRTRLLVEVNESETDVGFLPGRPLESIRVVDVLDAMRRGVGGRLPTREGATRTTAELALARVADATEQAGMRTLSDLVEDARVAEARAVEEGAGAGRRTLTDEAGTTGA